MDNQNQSDRSHCNKSKILYFYVCSSLDKGISAENLSSKLCICFNIKIAAAALTTLVRFCVEWVFIFLRHDVCHQNAFFKMLNTSDN